MNKIHDPNIDAMFRGQQAPQNVIASPLNDVQLVALLGAVIGATSGGQVTPHDAITMGIDLVAESCIQMHGGGLQNAIEAARQRANPNGAVSLMKQ